MASSRVRALSHLGHRALVAHPLERLRQGGTGLELFLAHHAGEGLAPTRPEALDARARCDACESACPTGAPIARVVRHLLERAREADSA